MNILDYNASMKFARKEGVAIGEATGIAIGREEGVAIGEARGITLGESRGESRVLDLMAKGYDLEQIKAILKNKR
jgi:hypothetical protein